MVLVLAFAVCLATDANPSAQKPRTHRLEAKPDRVAYGYYWSEATPVLRIASGDIIDVDTLPPNTPNGLQRAGVAAERIQESLKAIVSEVTEVRRAGRPHPDRTGLCGGRGSR
jgi:hypothetical protein